LSYSDLTHSSFSISFTTTILR